MYHTATNISYEYTYRYIIHIYIPTEVIDHIMNSEYQNTSLKKKEGFYTVKSVFIKHP